MTTGTLAETVVDRPANAGADGENSTQYHDAQGKPTLDAALNQTFPASDPIPPDSKSAHADEAPPAVSSEPSVQAPAQSGEVFRFPKSVPTFPTSIKELPTLGPSITSLIRLDHAHLTMTVHKYRADLSPARKRAIVNTVCDALELHSQLMEEIYYPALRVVLGDSNDVLNRAQPEHGQMKIAISLLRDLSPEDADYDDIFMELIRDLLHHIADEESVLLPLAERQLTGRLGELGWLMARRRMQLVGPKVGDIAADAMRTVPTFSLLTSVALVFGGFLLGRSVWRGRS